MKNQKSTHHQLGIFALTMMGIAAILSLRNLPIIATYGTSLITYYIAAAILFFIPTALVSAELSTMWPDSGGLYVWVHKALGKRFGLLAIWFEWINTIFSFPAMMGFILFSLIFPFAHHMANNRLIAFGLMVGIFWCITLINFLGIKTSSWFSALGVILGVLLIFVFIIALGTIWFVSGRPIQIDLSWSALIPSFKHNSLAFLIVVINSLAGIQVIAFHAKETRNPSHTLPRVSLIIVCVILLFSISGALSIAAVTPHSGNSLVGGVVQALSIFLTQFHLVNLVKILVVLMALGVLAGLNSWVIGPSKGMLAAAEAGQLPKVLAYRNQHNMPTNILILQAIVTTILSAAYVYMPSVNSAFWLLSNLTSQFTVMMWILVFISAIVIQFRYANTPRPFKTPGGKLVMCAISGLGAIVCAIVLGVSYIPPDTVVTAGGVVRYETALIGGLLVFSILPLCLTAWLARYRKK